MQLSIIIPTLNEEESLSSLLPFLKLHANKAICEVIVCDAGSTDRTQRVCETFGVKFITCKQKGRPFQMNEGAALAKGEVLWFLHADTMPPSSFFEDIFSEVQSGYQAGCYRYQFDTDSSRLQRQARFTRLPCLIFRGGDQSLFITKELFQNIEGFNSYYFIMEDYDIIRRLKKRAQFKIIPKDCIVSARKYDENSYLRVNFANVVVFSLYYLGVSPKKLFRLYHQLIKHPKAA